MYSSNDINLAGLLWTLGILAAVGGLTAAAGVVWLFSWLVTAVL